MDPACSLETPINGENRSNQTFKRALAKLCQGTPTAPHHMRLAPRDKLSALEFLYGRPIPQAEEKGHLSPPKMQQPVCALQAGETEKALTEYGDQVLPAPTDPAPNPFQPGA